MMSENTPFEVTKAEILKRMQIGCDEFQAYIKTLSEAQLTGPTDAAGWTAKDHIMHLALWADGIVAVLQGQSRRERMGLDEATWNSPGFDTMNGVMQQQNRDKSLAEVLKRFAAAHQGMVAEVSKLSDADLLRPYNSYDVKSSSERPIYDYIMGDTFEHYKEHQGWMATIVEGA